MNWINDELEVIKSAELWREPVVLSSPDAARIEIDGKEYLNLSSNNYLGLATHPRVITGAKEAVERWGAGAGASRLLVGTFEIHRALEQEIAVLKGTESALVFPTGLQDGARNDSCSHRQGRSCHSRKRGPCLVGGRRASLRSLTQGLPSS